VTAASATVQALQAEGITRVALATPYPAHLNELLPALFGAAGITVVSLKSVAVPGSLEVCRLPPWTAYQLAREADTREAQAVCILATDIRTIDVLAALERDLGKPAVSTNQALMWRALSLGGMTEPLVGFGRLLARA
jgi:maleate cis-trans isomerase